MSSGDMVYRIADEPRISGLNRIAINPFFIILAAMILRLSAWSRLVADQRFRNGQSLCPNAILSSP